MTVTTRPIYLDHAASTPVRASARTAWLDAESVGAANASGSHRAARRARAAVDDARELLAEIIGVEPGWIVFTSGGTESDNLAVLGRAAAANGSVVCSSVEHPAVLEAVESLDRGATFGTDQRCLADLDDLARLLGQDDVSLVSIMAVNNEVGAVQPVAEVAALVRQLAPGAAIHTDAVQALNWIDLRSIAPHVDMLSLSAHKFGGPQGVGLCAVRPSVGLARRQLGGGQERDRRSGTLNVPGILAMAAAAEEADAERDAQSARLGALRDDLLDRIIGRLSGVVQTGACGDRSHIAAGFAHLCIAGVDSEALLFLLDEAGVYASAASACASGAQQSSHVLAAMGVDPALAGGSLRLTLGHTTTSDDIVRAGDIVVECVERLRRFPR